MFYEPWRFALRQTGSVGTSICAAESKAGQINYCSPEQHDLSQPPGRCKLFAATRVPEWHHQELRYQALIQDCILTTNVTDGCLQYVCIQTVANNHRAAFSPHPPKKWMKTYVLGLSDLYNIAQIKQKKQKAKQPSHQSLPAPKS